MPQAKTPKKPRLFPPSMAGQCMRYAVMELLGFGRLIEPLAQEAMREGSMLHKSFQNELLQTENVRAIEAPIRDPERGISGRMDAVVDFNQGAMVIEYKTVNHDKFVGIADEGPLVSHWAQLQLYLAIGDFAAGRLVVESRMTHGRLTYQSTGDALWQEWVLARVAAAREYQAAHKLPSREVSIQCAHCDRWQRCFKNEAERDEAISEHPQWWTEPPLPAEFRISRIS